MSSKNNRKVNLQEMYNPFLNTVIEPSEADCTKVDSSWSKLSPFYPYFRIYYVTDGNATMYLKNGTTELKAGYMYFIPAFSLISTTCENTMTHYWTHFNLDQQTCNYLSLINPLSCVKATKEDETVFSLLVEGMKKCNNINALTSCSGLSKHLFSRFLPEKQQHQGNSDFAVVLKYIDDHINANFSNTELANLMYLSPTYFSNSFTKKFGLSPKQYILKQKLTLASKMLIESNKTVKEIAYTLGYNNEMYFNRLFRSYTGIAPGQYRKIFKSKATI